MLGRILIKRSSIVIKIQSLVRLHSLGGIQQNPYSSLVDKPQGLDILERLLPFPAIIQPTKEPRYIAIVVGHDVQAVLTTRVPYQLKYRVIILPIQSLP